MSDSVTGTFNIALGLDADSLASCVSCGLCLPHCPTYRVSTEEMSSPRGRIALMNEVSRTGVGDQSFIDYMDECIQCMGCETACPAGVPYGSMMEATREALAEQTGYQPRWRRSGFWFLGHPRLLRGASSILAVLQRLHLVPSRLGLPKLPITRPRLRSTGEDVIVFTGCVMDAWMRDVHVATVEILEALGLKVHISGDEAPCCGALQSHAGLGGQARARAAEVVMGLKGTASIVVNSAGCGAQLKNFGAILGTAEAAALESRVFDVHEFLVTRLDDLEALAGERDAERQRVAVQDPCHLRHVQRNHLDVHAVLEPFVVPVSLDDEGLCCGAGGAYSVMHPDTASSVRDRKIDAIGRTGCSMVASANPGCMMHLAGGGLDVRHPVEIIAASIGR
jgi:glycolate oxidase iron-sulfur subunit